MLQEEIAVALDVDGGYTAPTQCLERGEECTNGRCFKTRIANPYMKEITHEECQPTGVRGECVELLLQRSACAAGAAEVGVSDQGDGARWEVRRQCRRFHHHSSSYPSNRVWARQFRFRSTGPVNRLLATGERHQRCATSGVAGHQVDTWFPQLVRASSHGGVAVGKYGSSRKPGVALDTISVDVSGRVLSRSWMEDNRDEDSVRGRGRELVLLLSALVIATSGYFWFGDTLSLEGMARQESSLRNYQQAHPTLVYGVAFAIYVAVTGLSLPGATVLTLVFGWSFGFLPGLLLVSFASTAGASLAFLLSRFVLREWIQTRFGSRLRTFNDALARDGAFYLLALRLIPAVPFFVVNLVMGLTPLALGTYWWVSQIGMLPGTAVYVYAGASVPDLQTLSEQGVRAVLSPRLFWALALLAGVALVARWGMARLFAPSSSVRRL